MIKWLAGGVLQDISKFNPPSSKEKWVNFYGIKWRSIINTSVNIFIDLTSNYDQFHEVIGTILNSSTGLLYLVPQIEDKGYKLGLQNFFSLSWQPKQLHLEELNP